MLLIQKHKQRAREITDEVLAGYAPCAEITPDLYSSVIAKLSALLKIPKDSLWHCGRTLIGKHLTRKNINRFVYFALVNKKEVSERIYFLDDQSLIEDTMIVRFAIPKTTPTGNWIIPFEILSGAYAGKRISVELYSGAVWNWLYKIGYVRGSKKYWIDGIKNSFPGLYAKLKMTPNGKTTLPECHYDIEETPSITSYNQKNIILYRNLYAECPHGFSEEQLTGENYCVSSCPKSWDFCTASGHPYECEDGCCNRCGNIGLFPIGSYFCLNCVLEGEYSDV